MVINFSKIKPIDTSPLNINQANAYYHLVTCILEGKAYSEAEYSTQCLYHLTTDELWSPVMDVYKSNNL